METPSSGSAEVPIPNVRLVVPALIALIVSALSAPAPAGVILAPAQRPTLADAIRDARSGDVIRIIGDCDAGGRAVVEDGLRIRGARGAVVRGDLTIVGDSVRLSRVTLRGGEIRIQGQRARVRRCNVRAQRGAALTVIGREASVRKNRVLAAQRRFWTFSPGAAVGLRVTGTRVRVTHNRVTATGTGIDVHGDRAVVARNDVRTLADGIRVAGFGTLLRENEVSFPDRRRVDARGVVVGPRADGAVILDNVVSDGVDGYVLDVSGATIRGNEVRQGLLGGKGFHVSGGENLVEENSSKVDRGPGLVVVGDRNTVRAFSAFSGGDASADGIVVEGSENTLADVSVSFARSPRGLRIVGDRNVVEGSSIETHGWAVVELDGAENVFRGSTARAVFSGTAVRISGERNVVQEAVLYGLSAEGVLYTSGVATVVRATSVWIVPSLDAPHVVNDGTFAVFEDVTFLPDE